jgi:protein TonB
MNQSIAVAQRRRPGLGYHRLPFFCFSLAAMPHRIPHLVLLLVVAVLAACSSILPGPEAPPAAGGAASASGAASLAAYKSELAHHIARASGSQVFAGRPQALLRSVVVLQYQLDGNGRLLRSNIMRSNHDRLTENLALASLRQAVPLPRPAPHLLRRGQMEVVETWLFNDDGRFQLRSIAESQMDQ